MFNYKWITTPEMELVAKQHLARSAQAFGAWRKYRNETREMRGETTKPRQLKQEFDVWWRLHGPVNFTTFEDTRRYKEDLWRIVSA